GIRDATVTGVQTCALPICEGDHHHRPAAECPAHEGDVVFAGLLVEEVRARDVRVPSRQCLQRRVAGSADPAETLPWPAILDPPRSEERRVGKAGGAGLEGK